LGYDVRITRKARWYEDVGPVITGEEWTSFVNARSDLQWYDNVGAKPDTGVLVLSVTDREDAMIWWDARLGEVKTKNPSGGLVHRMVELARELDAVVMGDESETYHLPDRINVPLPFFEDPENKENVWRMPTPEQIAVLEQKHAEWRAKALGKPATNNQEIPAKRTQFATWKIAAAIIFVSWLLWKAFGTSGQ
jgi:hypothetical protein